MKNEGMDRELDVRHKIEEQFHDDKASRPMEDFYGYGALGMADEHLFQSLGDLRGKRLLEIGCGDGQATVRFAKAGASVVAIDISGGMVEATERAARDHGVSDRVEARKMGGEDLEFPEGTFDLVYGHSILHHLNLDIAGPRLAGVLKRGGAASFLEPLEYNPVLNLFRKLTPHRRTPTEKPVRWEELEAVGRHFARWDHHEFYLLSLAAFVWYYGIKSKPLFQSTQNFLAPADRWLFSALPSLRKFAWVTVVRFFK